MTPDLQARIETLARECGQRIVDAAWHTAKRTPDTPMTRERVQSIVTATLTTLAASIIAEKDAEAAGMRAKLDESEGTVAAMRERLELGGKVAARIGVAHGKDVIERLSDWWYEGTLQLLYKDGIPIHTAGRDLLAELAQLRKEAAWIRAKLKLPIDTPFSSGGSDTVCGGMHVLESNAHGYSAYVAAFKCDDKQGEIARLAVAVREKDAELVSLRERVRELEGDLKHARQFIWHVIQASGGLVRIDDRQLASVRPGDECRVETYVDARRRCTVAKSLTPHTEPSK